MIVYHGSTEIVRKPLVNVGRPNLDFGRGFYVTTLRQQAVSWALRPINIYKEKYLNIFNFDFDTVRDKGYKILTFDNYNREWLDFVVGNRKGKQLWKPYDLVIGGVANDRVFNTVELYASQLITAEEALQRLSYHKPNNQICILKQVIVEDYLHFVKSEILKER